MIENTLHKISKLVFDRFASIRGHIKGWEVGKHKTKSIEYCEKLFRNFSVQIRIYLGQISRFNSCIYIYIYISSCIPI